MTHHQNLEQLFYVKRSGKFVSENFPKRKAGGTILISCWENCFGIIGYKQTASGAKIIHFNHVQKSSFFVPKEIVEIALNSNMLCNHLWSCILRTYT